MKKKLYKAEFTVLFVSDEEDFNLLQKEAKVHAKEELYISNNCFRIEEIKTPNEVPIEWFEAIPHGDSTLQEHNISCLEFIEIEDKDVLSEEM